MVTQLLEIVAALSGSNISVRLKRPSVQQIVLIGVSGLRCACLWLWAGIRALEMFAALELPGGKAKYGFLDPESVGQDGVSQGHMIVCDNYRGCVDGLALEQWRSNKKCSRY